MPFTKTFGTTSGAYSTATLWKPIDVSNPYYAWTLSGSGTSEYYLRTAALANPGFVAQPDNVYLNGSNATEGTMGTLAAGTFDYGDNDALGYSTIYVRTSGSVDPDTLDPFYVKFYQTPRATEHVRFAADSASINSATGLDQSGTAIGDFIVEEGYAGTIGSATLGYLYIDPDRFDFHGEGECWIDIWSANISPQIYGTASADDGEAGLYLRGSNIATLSVNGGAVGVAMRPGETTTVATLRILEGSGHRVIVGNGVTLTTLHVYGGDVELKSATTTIIVYEGTLTTQGIGAITTLTERGGTVVASSTGTITTFHLYGGTLDLRQSGVARTITTLNKYPGNRFEIKRNNEVVTITTEAVQGSYTETGGL